MAITEFQLRNLTEYVAENQANAPLYTERHIFPAVEIGGEIANRLIIEEAHELGSEMRGVDFGIVEAGLLLHDIGYDRTFMPEERDHIVKGMVIAERELNKIGVDSATRSRIVDTIRTHDGRFDDGNNPIENYVVNDADQVAVFKEIPWMYVLMRDAFGMNHERALMGCMQETWKSYNKVIEMDLTRKMYKGDYDLSVQWLRSQTRNVDPAVLRFNVPRDNVEETLKFYEETIKGK